MKYVDDAVTFETAEAECYSAGNALVFMADSQEKLEIVRQLEPSERVWVGLEDRGEEGVYRWVDGRLATAEHMGLYNVNEPNDYGGDEDCTVVKNDITLLNDVPCSIPYRYICEIPMQ